MLLNELWGGDAVGDRTGHDRVRARRVVEYIRHRFPAVRYTDAPDDVDPEVDRVPNTGEPVS